MSASRDTMLTKVERYYSAKLETHGTSAAGVDWNGADSQLNRFHQLLRIVAENEAYSLNDVGCGYGALLDVIETDQLLSSYLGVDISPEMVKAASARHKSHDHIRFVVGSKPDRRADYCVASGIFNVRFETPDNEWLAYILETLEVMHQTSEKGFSFNCLTSYSDSDKMQDHLFYADPCFFFDHCKSKYSRNVALLHDYGLYEFTVLVRKQT